MSATVFPLWLVARGPAATARQQDEAFADAGLPEAAACGPLGSLRVEAAGLERVSRHRAAWKDLCGRALEPNLFFDPDFLLPAAQHLAFARRPLFFLVWRASGFGERLVGLCPVRTASWWTGRAAIGVWRHEQGALGTPLLDRAVAAPALDALMDFAGRVHPAASGLMFSDIPATGPFAALLRDRAMRTGAHLREYGRHERAVLPLAAGRDPLEGAPQKRLKEWRRLRRRLEEEAGPLTFRIRTTPPEVRHGMEDFLTLESRGWKGARGTALLMNASLAVFARAASRLMAREGKCRIVSLECAGVPVAMGIVLLTQGRAAFWKTAYDEAFARFSPGVLLTLELTRALHAEGAVALVDSCAIADHPMIDRIWRDRQAMADHFMAFSLARNGGFAAACLRETAHRRLRQKAKAAWYRLRGGKVS